MFLRLRSFECGKENQHILAFIGSVRANMNLIYNVFLLFLDVLIVIMNILLI